jgi:hypothetical protein
MYIKVFNYLNYISNNESVFLKVSSLVHKQQVAAKKKHIQEKFRSEMGLLIDIVLQGIRYL